MNKTDLIVRIILDHYPALQAIYLFGTFDTEDERPDSDIDISILLPPSNDKQTGHVAMSNACVAIEQLLGKKVDLINLRQVSTVFQKEIIMAERRIFCADTYAADEFEMLAFSCYQKLNEERAELLNEGLSSGRFYKVRTR